MSRIKLEAKLLYLPYPAEHVEDILCSPKKTNSDWLPASEFTVRISDDCNDSGS